MGSSCEGDALFLCRLLGFAVHSFDRPPQLGAVGPVVYALNKFSPLSSLGSHHSLSTAGLRRDPACVGRLAPPSWLRSPLGLVACIAYVIQWGYDGNQPSMVSLRTTSRLSGNKLEDDRAQFAFYLLSVSGTVSLLEVDEGSVPGRR